MKVPRVVDRAASGPLPWFERMMLAVGVDRALIDAALGDLNEEHAARVAEDGPRAAHRWYVREALRSTPHLVLSAACRVDSRRRLLVAVAILAGVVVTVLFLALQWRSAELGPPARIVAGVRDTVVVNQVQPMALPMRVLDSAGRMLADSGVRYTWMSGAPVTISARGAVECRERGDARVRATLGELSTVVALLCRPLSKINAMIWNDFVLGDPSRELPAEFIGTDGEPVTLLMARVTVNDSSVATLDGLRIRPRRPGKTYLSLAVGKQSTGAAIRVFAPVSTLNGLLPEQRPQDRYVAAKVHLASQQSIRWTLPVGLFSLQFLPEQQSGAALGGPAPLLTVAGPIMCLPRPRPGVYTTRCLARGPGSTVLVAHPGSTERAVRGALALDWERVRDY